MTTTMTRKTRAFVGRQWLARRVEDHLLKGNTRITVKGKRGHGKTAFTRQVVLNKNWWPTLHARVRAHHHVKDEVEASNFLQHLADGLKEAENDGKNVLWLDGLNRRTNDMIESLQWPSWLHIIATSRSVSLRKSATIDMSKAEDNRRDIEDVATTMIQKISSTKMKALFVAARSRSSMRKSGAPSIRA